MNRLMTPEEVAKMLGVKPSTIYQWKHQGYIPHVKLGRLLRFRESDINQWIETKTENGRATRKLDITDIGL